MRIISEILIIKNYNRDYSYLKTLTNKHNIMNCYISMGFRTLKYHLVTRVPIFYFLFFKSSLKSTTDENTTSHEWNLYGFKVAELSR